MFMQKLLQSKINHRPQPPELYKSVLYGNTVESHINSQYKKISNIWPDSWNQIMSNEIPSLKPIRMNTMNSENGLSVENSRGKYLLSLAQSHKK